MQSKKRVLVAGPVFLDSIYGGLPSMPKLGREIFGETHALAVGGLAITAIGLVRLGLSVSLASAVGRDLFGNMILEWLQQEGVNCQKVRRLEDKKTSSTTALIYDGDRAFVSHSGAKFLETELLNEKVCWEKLGHLHLSLSVRAEISVLLRKARSRGVSTSVTTGWDGAEFYASRRPLLGRVLENTSMFFCNALEAKKLAGQNDLTKAAHFFMTRGCRPVITMGPAGAFTLDEKGEVCKVNALKVDFKDPTGAGDSFAAGFLAGRAYNWSWAKSLKLGAICGSLVTRALGGSQAFPANLSEALKYMDEVN